MERAVTFGDGQSLTGILGVPEAVDDGRPAVLFWNVGILHHVGPHRLYVDLARRLNASGFVTLRFDLSGRGDSAPSRDASTAEERAAADIGRAMELVASRTSIERFVLVGLCSGADDAHRVARAESRVAGVVFIDGYGYPTARFHLRRYASFLSSPSRIAAFCSRTARRLCTRLCGRTPEIPWERRFGWTPPPRATAQGELQRMIDRGCELLFLYSGDVHRYYNYEGQFDDMFPDLDARGRVEHAFCADADHLFSLPGMRRELMERLETWLAARFGTVDSPLPGS